MWWWLRCPEIGKAAASAWPQVQPGAGLTVSSQKAHAHSTRTHRIYTWLATQLPEAHRALIQTDSSSGCIPRFQPHSGGWYRLPRSCVHVHIDRAGQGLPWPHVLTPETPLAPRPVTYSLASPACTLLALAHLHLLWGCCTVNTWALPPMGWLQLLALGSPYRHVWRIESLSPWKRWKWIK